MGYACPVCDRPQVDGRHLADHVAFTALTGEAAHEDWLDEQVPGWGQLGAAELAAEIVDHAEETDVETVFEESRVDGPDPDRRVVPPADLDDDAADVLAEAREYTRRMADDGDADTESGARTDEDSSADETE